MEQCGAYPRRDAGGTAGGSDRQQCGTAVFENGDGKFAEGWIYCFSVTFPAGEASKNIRTLNNLYEGFADGGLTRGDGVVALGGGVTGDMAELRSGHHVPGVDFIQIPTTLLAQVDSSVGGKTAIDLPQGKNLVGAFYQPKLVLADTGCFATLRNAFCVMEWRK